MERALERAGEPLSQVTLPGVVVMMDDMATFAWEMGSGRDVHDKAVIEKAKEIVKDANTEWVEMDGYRAAMPEGWQEKEWHVDRGAIHITWNGKRWRVRDLHMGIDLDDPKSIAHAKQRIADPHAGWIEKGVVYYLNDSVSQ